MTERHNINNSLEEAHSKRVLIISACANDVVVSRLIDGACRALTTASIKPEHQEVMRVSGALEIPLALKMAARTNFFHAFVVLGAVIKGKTDHYDHVARMANDGVLQVALEHQIALGNGILTVHSMEHALERADGPCGNLGNDAANAALNLLSCSQTLAKKMAHR
jgi:6,7-dimethyl-8-ribityllumazine synthase